MIRHHISNLANVKKTIEGKAIQPIIFVWMQGEHDAQTGQAKTYADNS